MLPLYIDPSHISTPLISTPLHPPILYLPLSHQLNINPPTSPSPILYLPPSPVGDVENGCTKDSPDLPGDNREVDKKGAVGINPVVNAWLVQAWTSVRYSCPAALPYIGDRPPRIGLLGQGLVVYVLVLHLYLLLFHARC